MSGQNSIEFLSGIISQGEIRPTNENNQSTFGFPRPSKVNQEQRFLMDD